MKKIITDQKFLRKRCQKVSLKKGLEISRELVKFLDHWNKDHPHNPGIGLAANQLGINARVCVVLLNSIRTVFVNPKIIACANTFIPIKEGCLSLPGITLQVYRQLWVTVHTDNLSQDRTFGIDPTTVTGKPYEVAALESACVQHEISHLAGLLITDFTNITGPDPLSWFKD